MEAWYEKQEQLATIQGLFEDFCDNTWYIIGQMDGMPQPDDERFNPLWTAVDIVEVALSVLANHFESIAEEEET